MHQKIKELFDEASSVKGMLDEIGCKCRLILSPGYNGDGTEYAEQMRSDLNKYSKRLQQIFVELRTYAVPKLE